MFEGIFDFIMNPAGAIISAGVAGIVGFAMVKLRLLVWKNLGPKLLAASMQRAAKKINKLLEKSRAKYPELIKEIEKDLIKALEESIAELKK